MNIDVDVNLFTKLSKDLQYLILLLKIPSELKAICTSDKYFANLCRNPNFKRQYMERWNEILVDAEGLNFFTKEGTNQRQKWVQRQLLDILGTQAHYENVSKAKTKKDYYVYDNFTKKQVAAFKEIDGKRFLVITPFKCPEKMEKNSYSNVIMKKASEKNTVNMQLI